ncbi:MAG: transcriptional regulator NrdR [Microthrixaceae bacterium]
MSSAGSVLLMRCPACGALDDKVIDSRAADDGTVIRRRRQCEDCATRFTTFERLEEVPTVVVKRDGRRVPFDREKIEVGVRSACKGRPVDEATIAALAVRVEHQICNSRGEVPVGEVGELVLAELREIDQVSAVRFASVYKSFEGPEDFEREVQLLGHGEDESTASVSQN